LQRARICIVRWVQKYKSHPGGCNITSVDLPTSSDVDSISEGELSGCNTCSHLGNLGVISMEGAVDVGFDRFKLCAGSTLFGEST
jgi:hypothetical protein